MNPAVVKRFIFIMVIALALVGGTSIFMDSFLNRPPGDYETERGDMYLSSHRIGRWTLASSKQLSMTTPKQ